MARLAVTVCRRLAEDGMFSAGLDSSGHAPVEGSILNPGRSCRAHMFEAVSVAQALRDAVQCKVDYVALIRSQRQQRGVGDIVTIYGRRKLA